MKFSFFVNYATAFVVTTIITLTIYAAVQQNYRTGLNDPQVQVARDLRLQIENNKPIDAAFNANPVDLAKSLSPFIVLYNAAGKAINSNGMLDGKLPQIPIGLFEVVKNNGEHDVTWQPGEGVRMAMVIVKVNSNPVQFIAVGRSMSEVENRIQNMSLTIFIAWGICIGIIFIAMILSYRGSVLQKKNK